MTGAGGYLGTSLVPMLLAQGYKVRALDRFFFGRKLLPEHEQLKLIKADSTPRGDVTGHATFVWYVWKDGKYAPKEVVN